MRFIVELSTLAGLWFWGDTRPVAGAGPLATVFGIVIVGAALWWLLAAARAAYRLERPLRLAFQAGMFGVGVLAAGSRPAATDRRAGRQFDRRPNWGRSPIRTVSAPARPSLPDAGRQTPVRRQERL